VMDLAVPLPKGELGSPGSPLLGRLFTVVEIIFLV
jgi:hypothetical protein